MKYRIGLLLAGPIAAVIAADVLKVPLAWSSNGPRDWRTPSSASQRKNPVPPDRQSMAAGRAIYEQECVSCHGSGGKGDGKDGMDLEPRPADLSSPAVARQSDGAIFWKVAAGRRPMPGFRRDLNDEQRWHVVNYIRALANRR